MRRLPSLRAALLALGLLLATVPAPPAFAELRPAAPEEAAAIRALWEEGARALVARRGPDLASLANAETLALVEAEKRWALSARSDALLRNADLGHPSCLPHGSALRALYFRSLYIDEPFFLETVAAEEYLGDALYFTLRTLARALGDNWMKGDSFGERLWLRPDYPYELWLAALRDRVETEPGAAWALIGGELVVDDRGRAYLLSADTARFGLLPSFALDAWPFASRDAEGRWQLDLRWLLGPLLERAVHLDYALVHWRARLAGQGDGRPPWLGRLRGAQVTDAYGAHLLKLLGRENRLKLLAAVDEWPAEDLPCPSALWPQRATQPAFLLLRAGLRSLRLASTLDGPETTSDEDAVNGLYLRYGRALWRGETAALAALADRRSLLAFEALRQVALHAPRSFLVEAPTRHCVGPYSRMQVLRLRALFSAEELAATTAGDILGRFLEPALGRGPRSCVLHQDETYRFRCTPPSASIALSLFGVLLRGQAFETRWSGLRPAIERARREGLGDFLVIIENRAFAVATHPRTGERFYLDGILASRAGLGPWLVNFTQSVRELEGWGSYPQIKGNETVGESLTRLADWTGIVGDETLFDPPLPQRFDAGAACFLATLSPRY